MKSIFSDPRLVVDRDRHAQLEPIVERIDELPVMQPVDDAAHGFFGVVLHMAHIGLHHIEPEVIDHPPQFLDALFAGRDLRLQVGHVLGRVARGVGTGFQQIEHFGFAQVPAVHQREVVDQDAFLIDRRGIGWHRSRRNAADVGLMPAAAGKEEQARRCLRRIPA